MLPQNFTYPSSEKLKSKKQITALFSQGRHIKNGSLRLIFLPYPLENATLKMGVSVSKRNFKNATDRNRIKRLLREVYRLNQHLLKSRLTTPHVFMLIYQGNECPFFEDLNLKIKFLFEKF